MPDCPLLKASIFVWMSLAICSTILLDSSQIASAEPDSSNSTASTATSSTSNTGKKRFPPCTPPPPPSSELVSPGVFKKPLRLSTSLECRRQEFESYLLEAQKRLRTFAYENAWDSFTDTPMMESSEIYATKKEYDDHLYSIEPSLRGKPIPKTFTAGIEHGIFFAVSPEMCDEVFPEGKEKDSYIKLIQHELAHRLHVRLVKGNEERMGPVWFYEGFAVYAADQYTKVAPKLTEKEIWEVVNDSKRGSYLKYRTVMEYFLKKYSLQELVDHAGDKDFVEWLKKGE